MKTVEVQGGEVAAWDVGSGQPLVVIHGTGTPGELWRADLLELDRVCRVITYDRRGYGASSPSPGSWRMHRDDAATVIESLGAAPAVVVGYAGGASVALDIAVNRPELVAGLVLIDPILHTRSVGRPGLGRRLAKVRLLRRLRGDEAAAEEWIRFISSYESGGNAWDRAVPARKQTILANASGVLADIDAADHDYLDESRLAEIQTPVTIVDPKLGPAVFRRSVERLRELLPKARLVTLDRSSHIVMLDAREEVLDVLRRAVTEPARISRRSGGPPPDA